MLKSRFVYLLFFILITGTLMTGCTFSISGEELANFSDEERENSSDEITLDLDNVSLVSADIDDTVGSISVEYSDDTSVHIDVQCKASGKEEDDLLKILEVAKVEAGIYDDELQVKVIHRDTKEDIWKWIEDEYRGNNKPNLSVELTMTLPRSIQKFDIKCDVGSVDIDSLKGEFDITNNVGNVKMSDITFTDDSNITVDVGDITCGLNKEQLEDVTVSLITNVGSINLDTENLPYTTDDTNGDNFLGTSKTILVNETCKIKTKISVGKLRLR